MLTYIARYYPIWLMGFAFLIVVQVMYMCWMTEKCLLQSEITAFDWRRVFFSLKGSDVSFYDMPPVGSSVLFHLRKWHSTTLYTHIWIGVPPSPLRCLKINIPSKLCDCVRTRKLGAHRNVPYKNDFANISYTSFQIQMSSGKMLHKRNLIHTQI